MRCGLRRPADAARRRCAANGCPDGMRASAAAVASDGDDGVMGAPELRVMCLHRMTMNLTVQLFLWFTDPGVGESGDMVAGYPDPVPAAAERRPGHTTEG